MFENIKARSGIRWERGDQEYFGMSGSFNAVPASDNHAKISVRPAAEIKKNNSVVAITGVIPSKG